jgi:hypothetical protein
MQSFSFWQSSSGCWQQLLAAQQLSSGHLFGLLLLLLLLQTHDVYLTLLVAGLLIKLQISANSY